MMTPAIFLDRDGVIVENSAKYVLTVDELEFLPGACQALADLASLPLKIIVVTNQSPVERGLLPVTRLDAIHAAMLAEIEVAGGRIDQVYYCPHHPNTGCACRKPEPGMLLQAAQAHQIDLSRSVMIGDAITDLEAGQRTQVARNILVKTGRGADQLQRRRSAELRTIEVFDNLASAIQALIPDVIS